MVFSFFIMFMEIEWPDPKTNIYGWQRMDFCCVSSCFTNTVNICFHFIDNSNNYFYFLCSCWNKMKFVYISINYLDISIFGKYHSQTRSICLSIFFFLNNVCALTNKWYCSKDTYYKKKGKCGYTTQQLMIIKTIIYTNTDWNSILWHFFLDRTKHP